MKKIEWFITEVVESMLLMSDNKSFVIAWAIFFTIAFEVWVIGKIIQ